MNQQDIVEGSFYICCNWQGRNKCVGHVNGKVRFINEFGRARFECNPYDVRSLAKNQSPFTEKEQ